MARNEPAIVAELGRPETPQETADRRAAASAKRRGNQTIFNLIIATVASLGVVLLLVIVVVRPDPGPVESIDVASIAADAQAGAEASLVVPVLPETWSANAARFGEVAEVPTWYIGYVTPETQFIALNQGIGANVTWLAEVVDDLEATGAATLDGIDWTLYENRGDRDAGNHAYAMSADIGDSTIVLHGTASDAEFQAVALAVAAEAGRR